MRKTPAHIWHELVFQRDNRYCAAKFHHDKCKGMAQECHHIVYRAHLHSKALWIPENGIALSSLCHAQAHREHNQNLRSHRLREAVDAVNALHRSLGFPLRPYFVKKAA